MEYQSDDGLAELVAFAAVVDASGFSAAARTAGLRKATLVLRVKRLEERLGVRLLARTTRTLRLTDAGRAYLEHGRRALASLREAEAAVASTKETPTGTLRVTTSPALAGLLLDAVVAPYLRDYPAVKLELDASTRTVDLSREDFDLAIRVGALSDSSLQSRRLGVAMGGYYASPSYLAERGTPRRPEDLRDHDAIVIPRLDRAPIWHFAQGGRKRSVIVRPRLLVSGFELGLHAAVAQLGIVPSPSYCVRAHLTTKQLARVLTSWTPPGFDVHAVFPRGGALTPKTRSFIDRLAAWFKVHGGRL